MIRGLNAGFGHPIAHEFAELTRRGVQKIRQGLLPAESGFANQVPGGPESIRNSAYSASLVAEFNGQSIGAYWLTDIEAMVDLPDNAEAGLLNEPNFHSWTAEAYGDYCNQALDRLGDNPRRITLFGGSIGNMSTKDLDWLKTAVKRAPRLPGVEFHWYPKEDDQEPWRPTPKNKTIKDQFIRLREAADGRRIVCGEFGIHMAPMTRGFWIWKKTTRLTEMQQRDRLRWMFDTMEDEGVEAAYVYQLNDGQSDDGHGRRGIRTVDGKWKAAADPATGVFV